MKRFAQIDAGVVTGTINLLPPEAPAGRSFVDVTDVPEATEGSRYRAETRTFLPPEPITPKPTALDLILADLRAIKAKLGA